MSSDTLLSACRQLSWEAFSFKYSFLHLICNIQYLRLGTFLSNRCYWTRSRKKGTYRRTELNRYSKSLNDKDVIVGSGWGFNLTTGGSIAFLMKGPGYYEFSV